MENEELYMIATYILQEIKKSLQKTNTSKYLIEGIYIFETENNTWNISIPEKVYYKKLYVAGINYKESDNFFEQIIINSVKKYASIKGKEGIVINS